MFVKVLRRTKLWLEELVILTSGGDSPGMNAAIRAVTRVGLNSGLEVFGIYNGYKGMVEGYIEPLTRETVGEIVESWRNRFRVCKIARIQRY